MIDYSSLIAGETALSFPFPMTSIAPPPDAKHHADAKGVRHFAQIVHRSAVKLFILSTFVGRDKVTIPLRMPNYASIISFNFCCAR